LKRDPKLIAKFFGKELFAQTIVQGNSLVINKRVSYEQIRKKLKQFIDTFVKCPVCGKPDTSLIEKGRKIYYIKCHACGAETPVTYKL
jgi:translation initiation factor 2 subunit 2